MSVVITNVSDHDGSDRLSEYVVRINNGPVLGRFEHWRANGLAECLRLAADEGVAGSNPATPTNKIKGFPALPLSIKTSLRTETGPKRKKAPRHLSAAGRGNMQKLHRGQKTSFFAESAKKSGRCKTALDQEADDPGDDPANDQPVDAGQGGLDVTHRAFQS